MASVENGNIAPAGVVCAAGGGIAGICTSQLDELKVLMIGNSFSRPVARTLPALAKSAGVRLDIASLYIGGCSLERHARNIKNDAAEYLIERNNNGERLTREKARISEWLPKEKWDIVTIQQASPLSWRPETFEPWGDEVIAEIRRLAPQAEIVVQETWSYNAADGRLKKEGKGAWGFGQDEMYRRIHEAVGSFAKKRGLRVIPTGAAIQAARAKGGEDVVGNGGDTIHLNEAGEKIQAEVWLKTLFGNLDVERRITELLSRMTLEEKIGQLSQTNGGNPSGAQSEDMSEAPLDPAFLAELAAGRYGSLLGKRGAKNYNILQEAAMSGRLGIPLLVGHDMIHSSRTCFPIPLALSCAFDDDLWERIGAAIAVESLTVGCNWTFTPMIDVARDARWGRIAESAGSDPLVTSRFGAAMVRGLQGDDLADGRHIAACAKHYVAYGAPLGGRDYNAVELSDATLRDIYLPPFRAAVAAGVATVMPAFHSFNDVPCSMNSYLLRDILRGEMGFKGMTISDWEAVGELVPHGVATPGADAAAKALNAGMDMEMVSTHYADGLAEAVASGIVREETLDAAVRNVLRLKFRMGLFDHPTIDAPALEKTIDFAAHRALAREAAAKSCVLLKNGGVLPLKAPRVALLGDIAVNSRQMQGTWSTFDFSNTTNDTLLAGLLADGVSVSYTEAYTLTGRVDRAAIERACAEADAVIACFGDYLEKTGESNASARIELPGEQLAVVDAVKACGKPLVAVVFGGRPLAIPELAEKADAIVMAWNPGGAGGWGVADVLTGAAEPYGRLTTDFPNATGECPKFYNRTTTGRHHVPGARWTTRYNDVPFASVYPFGYGLAYTTFEYGGERVAVDGAEVVFSADITNTGSRGGSELVQVYTRDVLARTVRPRRELKGYQRVELAPGETKRVEIRVPVATLGYTVDKVYRVEPGEFEAWIAPDSDRGRKLIFTL